MQNCRFRHIGQVLYGREWASQLAEDFGVEPTTIRNWAKGETQLPTTAPIVLLAAARRRLEQIKAAIELAKKEELNHG